MLFLILIQIFYIAVFPIISPFLSTYDLLFNRLHRFNDGYFDYYKKKRNTNCKTLLRNILKYFKFKYFLVLSISNYDLFRRLHMRYKYRIQVYSWRRELGF